MIICRVIYFIFVLFLSSLYAENIKELQVFYDAMLSENKASVIQSNSSQTMYYLNDYGNYNFFVYSSNHFEGSNYGYANSSIIGLSGGSNINSKRFYSYGIYYANYIVDGLKTENAFVVFDYKQVYSKSKRAVKPFFGFSSTIHFFYNSGTSFEQIPDPTDSTIMIDYNVYHTFNNVLISPSAYFYMPMTFKPKKNWINYDASLKANLKFRLGLETITPFSYRQSWYTITDDAEEWAYRKYSKVNSLFYSLYFDLGFDVIAMLNKVVIKYDFSYRNYTGSRESKELVLSSSDASVADTSYSINYRDALAAEIVNTFIFDLNLLSFFVGFVKKGDYKSTFLGVKFKINEF